MEQSKTRCEYCIFFTDAPDTIGEKFKRLVGECRRFPPYVVPRETDIEVIWPIVDKNAWCGEFAVPDEEEGSLN